MRIDHYYLCTENDGVSKYLKGGGRYVHRAQAGFNIGHRK